jgi:ectoine hydroxylase-related dioxygenase (phytanoyl-CoA dioxygenase family)
VLDLDLGRDGCTVLPELLPAAEVAALRELVDRRVAGPGGESCARPNNTLVPLRWDDPVVAAVLADPDRVGRLARATEARDLRWISGYVSVKDPHSPPLWWHQDWWSWTHPVSFRPAPVQVALLLYLSATGPGTGALRVLPGSHRRSTPLHAALPEAHAAGAADPGHLAMADQPGQATLAVRAGDAVVTDYRLLHGTHANAADRRRDCVLLSFTPSWRDLPADVRGHLVQHPALPGPGEEPAGWAVGLLPSHDGPRADLPLDRDAPADFSIGARTAHAAGPTGPR